MTPRLGIQRLKTLAEAAALMDVPEDEARVLLHDSGFDLGTDEWVPPWAIQQAQHLSFLRKLGDENMVSKKRRRQREARVYFARAGELIKIGVANDPARRVKELQTGSGQPIELLGHMAGGPKHERRLHGKFRYIRERGEWFRATPALLRYIAENIE